MPVPRSKENLERWLKKLHFFPTLTSLGTPAGHSGTLFSDARNLSSLEPSVWTFYLELADIAEPARQPSRSISTHRSRSKSQPPPGLDVLPAKAVEPQVIESLEESQLWLSHGTLFLPDDWNRPMTIPQPANGRDILTNEAILVYIHAGTERIHYKWETRAYFDKLKDREANITIMEDRRTGDGQFNSQWWLLHAISYPRIHRISDEQEVDRFMALCIAGIFQMPDFMPLRTSQVMHPLSFTPIVPVSIMVQMQLVGWEKNLFPIAFAAQRGNMGASGLLANALQATLNMLILYFLSTRASIDDTLPNWLFIYGISYDDDGLFIFAHYPHLVEVAPRSDAQLARRYWGYVSVMVCDSYAKCFTSQSSPKFDLANAFLTIQAHTINVMKRLKQWAGYWDMEPLIRYARGRKR